MNTTLSTFRRRLALCFLSAVPILASVNSHAEPPNYPTRPIKVIVPFPAGGVGDVTARLLMTAISADIGQSIVIENRGGASGSIGTAVAARSNPDGYTLVLVLDTHAINPLVYKDLTYTNKDFAPISLITRSPMVLMATENLPVKSVSDLIQYAKKNPGKPDFGSVGPGSASHLTAEMFNLKAGVHTTHIPYKGGAPAQTALMSGEIQIMWGSTPYAMSVVRAGKTKAIAQASKTRSAVFPDLPTVAEEGLPDFEAYGWSGLLAPAGTPPAIVAFWNKELRKISNDPKVKQQLIEQGFDLTLSTPQEFEQFIEEQTSMWKNLIQTQHIPLS